MKFVKRQLLRLSTASPIAASFAPLTTGSVTILMLHRFRHEARGVEGDDPRVLRCALDYLRRHRYEILSLEEAFRRLANGEPVRRAVAFTIDDGYADQAEIGAPVFAEFDCPVTTFVTSGFLDGDLWFWWDRIAHVFDNTRRAGYEIDIAGRPPTASWDSVTQRNAAKAEFTEFCKRLRDEEKHAAIDRLAQALDVELPASPPARYAPMSWDQLRACERSGMTFGPHTVTHPILSQVTDAQSTYELTEGWRRLSAEATHPVPIFCYPNGQVGDFGEREIMTLQSMGLAGAVTGTPGHATIRAFRQHAAAPFLVRRIAYPGDLPMFVQYVSGLERFKQILRRDTP